MIRIFKFTGVALAVLLLALWWWLSSVNDYATPGTLDIDLFDAPVVVRRDTLGVPYIFAGNEIDLIRAQGFITAQDRLFQLEYYRLLIEGRLASVIGESALSPDILIRVMDVAGNARRHAAELGEPERAYLQAYAEGVNAYLACCSDDFPLELSLLDLTPSPWSVEQLMMVMHFIGFTHGRNMMDELLMAQLVATLGPERAAELVPLNINPDRASPALPVSLSGWEDWTGIVVPTASALTPARFPQLGSNNWAIGPGRSASGRAIVANDPHLDARILPGPWLPMGLFTPNIESFGLHLPGVPGFLVGRTGQVAWGVTNGYADTQDLFVETLAPEDGPVTSRTEVFQIKDDAAPDGIRTHTIDVRSTPRGPIVTDHPEIVTANDVTLSLHWALAGTQRPTIGIDRFLTATSVAEFDAAIADIDVMFFNVAFADASGNISRRSTGRVPIRSSGNGAFAQPLSKAWTGWIAKSEMPGAINPADGWVASANGDMRVEDYPYYYSSHFAPSYRYRRIKQVLSGAADWDAEDHWQLIRDDLNLHAQRLVPIIVNALSNEPQFADVADVLTQWDFRDDKDAIAPSLYHAIFEQLFHDIFADDLDTDTLLQLERNRYFWLERVDQWLVEQPNTPWFDDQTTPDTIESRDALIVRATTKALFRLNEELGEDRAQWQWGRLHTVQFVSPLRTQGVGANWLGVAPMPQSGSGETLRRGQYGGNSSFESEFFDSAQFVSDFANTDYVIGVISGGVTARQWHDGFKSFVPLWARDDYAKWWIDPEQARIHTESFIDFK
ncbi:MAG: penicillin acylase family protein [Pseudomonadota bacterium]